MKDKFYVTTPIYYVNGAPHLGHAYTSILADIFARHKRLMGNEVFFLTGTDEHGAKISRAAEAQKTELKKFVDDNAGKFKNLSSVLNISNDFFIRTSDEENHWKGAEKLWQAIEKRGDIYKAKYKGLYCVGCEAFVTEKELKDGKCVYHDLKPEILEEENYFFRLSKYAENIKRAIESGEMKIFPESRKNETLALIESGLNDISFSRPSKDINWGIPVPGDPSQIMYVWCDALANYISALEYGRGEKLFKKFWPADLHILAKDILRFHTVIWPAMLISAGLPLPSSFLVHGFINVDGRKMSKTLGNVIDPFLAADGKEYGGSDPIRYYLCRRMTPFEDGDFTYTKFEKAYNSDLANGLGNLVQRVAKLCELKHFVLSFTNPSNPTNPSFSSIFLHIENFEFNLAIEELWREFSDLDAKINLDKPWEKSDEEAGKNLRIYVEKILWLTTSLSIFLPETTACVFSPAFENKITFEEFG